MLLWDTGLLKFVTNNWRENLGPIFPIGGDIAPKNSRQILLLNFVANGMHSCQLVTRKQFCHEYTGVTYLRQKASFVAKSHTLANLLQPLLLTLKGSNI